MTGNRAVAQASKAATSAAVVQAAPAISAQSRVWGQGVANHGKQPQQQSHRPVQITGQHGAAAEPQRAQQARQSAIQSTGQRGAAAQPHHAQQASKSWAQFSGQRGAAAQPQRAQQARQAGLSGLGDLSEGELQMLQQKHLKPLVGSVVKVDDRTEDGTHQVFCDMAKKAGWGYYLDVRGKHSLCLYAMPCSPRVLSESFLPTT